MKNKRCNDKLKQVSSEIFVRDSLDLSFFDIDTIKCVLSLRVIEDDNVKNETLEKYKYFDNYFILKVKQDHYFISTNIYPLYKAMKINDYNIHQRKDKLDKIKENISNEK